MVAQHIVRSLLGGHESHCIAHLQGKARARHMPSPAPAHGLALLMRVDNNELRRISTGLREGGKKHLLPAGRGWLERSRGRPHCEVRGRWAPGQEMNSCSPFSRSIELFLPRFSISSNYNLEDILPQLGMRQVFSTKADLSGITGAKNLAVTQVSLRSLDNRTP